MCSLEGGSPLNAGTRDLLKVEPLSKLTHGKWKWLVISLTGPCDLYVLWTRNIAERKKMCHHSYSVFTHCEKFQLHNPSKTLKIKKWLDSTTIFFQWTLSYFLSDSFLLEQTGLLWRLFWFQNMSQESQCKVWSKSYKVSWSFEKKL